MEPYDPISRAPNEVDADTANNALILCLRFFSATFPEEFKAVLTQANELQQSKPQPIDPLDFLYRQLVDHALQRVLLFNAAMKWAIESNIQSEAIDIEPIEWKVTLKNAEEHIELRVSRHEGQDYPTFTVSQGQDQEEVVVYDWHEYDKWISSK
jgi:hypothetical protein